MVDSNSLSPCVHWSIENKCCRLLYNNNCSQKYSGFKMDVNDYDKNCNGKSNSSLCIAYCHPADFMEKQKPKHKIEITGKRLL